MKKFRFKDGLVITASSVEEAKVKHKIVAKRGRVSNTGHIGRKSTPVSDEEQNRSDKAFNLIKSLGLVGITNIDTSYGGVDVFLNCSHCSLPEFDKMYTHFDTLEEFESSISENKDKWKKLFKAMTTADSLTTELGMIIGD